MPALPACEMLSDLVGFFVMHAEDALVRDPSLAFPIQKFTDSMFADK